MAHVGVIFGGRSVEHHVSIRSARTVAKGLREAGHQVTPLGIAPDGRGLGARRPERSAAGARGTRRGAAAARREAAPPAPPLGIAQAGCWIDAARSEEILAGGSVIAPVGEPIA